MSNLILWLAQGFGVGRIPFAPGTFGSLLGLAWFALLLWPRNLWIFLGGAGLGVAISIWLCGEGERILGRKDPGSVVMDEIAAMPFCFLWLFLVEGIFKESGTTTEPLFKGKLWLVMLAGFLVFRLFDIWKPWPVRQSQDLPGGWGITVDDLLAAVYTNLVVGLAALFIMQLKKTL